MELARKKEKYFFQAGTELMGIWSFAVDDEQEMVSKLSAFFFFLIHPTFFFFLLREVSDSEAFCWESDKAFIFVIWYLKSNRYHFFLELLEGELRLGWIDHRGLGGKKSELNPKKRHPTSLLI